MKAWRHTRRSTSRALSVIVDSPSFYIALVSLFSLVLTMGLIYLYEYHSVLFEGIVSVAMVIAAGIMLLWIWSIDI